MKNKKDKNIKSSLPENQLSDTLGGGTLTRKKEPDGLKRFDKNKREKRIILGILAGIFLIIGSVILYRSYANYEENKSYNVLKGQVGNFIENDIELSMLLNGEKTTSVPEKGDYNVEVTCDNGAIGSWDYEEWGPNIRNLNNSKVKCSINFTKEYTEELLHGSDPVLAENLVPVTIENNGVVKKANTQEEWYNYASKKWANAVILVDKNIMYNASDVIPEENIESYFVWIPKYSYELFDLGNYTTASSETPTGSIAKSINIKFGTTDTSDNNTGECTTPMASGESGNCEVGDYMTHPAFLTMNTNGLWVGKFETTGSTSNLTVKPNVTALTSINASTMFTTAYNYQRELDSHMIKNTEWGAVAYLSHSIYGINTEVNINNNSKRLTGYSATDESDQTDYPGTTGTTEEVTQAYNTETGYKASTTGNISGIYDMSGGSHEYMASYKAKTFGSSGFTEESITAYDKKYFDVYNENSTETSYFYRILGDATGEMGPFYNFTYKNGSATTIINNWYVASSKCLKTTAPFFMRGGYLDNGILAGHYSFGADNGRASSLIGFRLTLAIS